MQQPDEYLFDVSQLPNSEPEKTFRQFDTPLWTKNKALFIARYLKTFTYVTKHGTYIDAFAGPQDVDSKEQSWSAKLVMSNKPPWLRNFILLELDQSKIPLIEAQKEEYLSSLPERPKRSVEIIQGNSNETLPELLNKSPLREKEAAFCLLDQRSTECDWATVKHVASHKGNNGGHKIEIFYFLAQGWLDRGIKSWKIDSEARGAKWWGSDGINDFLKLSSPERARHMASRFKDELGYKYAYPFPIQDKGVEGRVMFWMIHASDHPRASDLMYQAYRHVGAGGGLNDIHPEFQF